MSDSRKSHFASVLKSKPVDVADDGIWDLPEEVIEDVFGGADFSQSVGGGYVSFAQNYSCFAQNIGNFSQGTYPG